MTDKFIPSTQFIEKLPDICVDLELVSVYDMDCYSVPQLLYRLAQKINDTITNMEHNDEALKAHLEDLQVKLEYLLSEGLTVELQKLIEKMYADGTLQALVGEAMVDFNRRLTVLENKIVNSVGVTVEMYGAKGDGDTDDTKAFQRALADAVAINLGAKTYVISDTLKLSKGQSLIGKGYGSTILKMKDGSTKTMILLDETNEKVTIKDLALHHGTTTGEATLKIDDTTSSIHDEHHLIENVLIYGTADYGVLVTSQCRENRFINVAVRADNKINAFRILGTDNFISTCTAVGAKSEGFYIGGPQNKLINCKAFYNDMAGFMIKGCNFIQLTGCEAQENGTHGFQLEDTNHGIYTNLISDTNGRLGDGDVGNFYFKNVKHCILIGQSSRWQGLAGNVKNHIKIEGWTQMLNLTVNTSSDNFANVLNTKGTLENIISGKFIINGIEIKPYQYEMTLKRSQGNPKVSDNFRNVEIDSSVYNNTTRLMTSEGYQVVEGVARSEWQGIKLYTQFIRAYGNKAYLNFQGFVLDSCIEVTINYYDINQSLISSSAKANIGATEPNKDVCINLVGDIPSNCAFIDARIATFNDRPGGPFTGFIKAIRLATE